MNTPVNFETAKLLKEKGFDAPTLHYYFEDGELREHFIKDTYGYYEDEYTVYHSESLNKWNGKFLTDKDGNRCIGCKKSEGYLETYSAPKIHEAVMWLYENYGIWIAVTQELGMTTTYCCQITGEHISSTYKAFIKSPIEAYEAAIKYILNEIKGLKRGKTASLKKKSK